MPIQVALGRENAALGYSGSATHMALHTGVPTTGNEVTGGTYARGAVTWTPGAVDGTVTATVPTFNVPSGFIVTHVALWTASTGGSLVDWVTIDPADFSGDGTMEITDVTLVVA